MMTGSLAAFLDSCFSDSGECCAESALSPSETAPAIADPRKSRREIVIGVPFVANALRQKDSYITREEVSGVYTNCIGRSGDVRSLLRPPSAVGIGMTLPFVSTARVTTVAFNISNFAVVRKRPIIDWYCGRRGSEAAPQCCRCGPEFHRAAQSPSRCCSSPPWEPELR